MLIENTPLGKTLVSNNNSFGYVGNLTLAYDLKREVWNREEVERMILAIKESKKYYRRSRKYDNSKLGEWLKARDILILVMMFEQGCRVKEITSLRWEDINFDKGLLYIDGKNNKVKYSRTIPICNKIAPYWNYYLSFNRTFWEDSPYIFPSHHQRNHPLSPSTWKQIFREKICKPAGLWRKPENPGKARTSSYSLRHSKGTELLEQTGDIDLVANFLGHKGTSVTRAYLHFTRTRQVQMFKAINPDYTPSKNNLYINKSNPNKKRGRLPQNATMPVL